LVQYQAHNKKYIGFDAFGGFLMPPPKKKKADEVYSNGMKHEITLLLALGSLSMLEMNLY